MAHSRDTLTSRKLPNMTFSHSSNPLTAPVLLDPSLPPPIRAARRFSVEGQYAVVTGGAGGLGLEAVRALLEHGLSGVCIFDMNPSIASAEATINALREEFPASKVLVLVVDVADEQVVESAVEQTGQEFGSIDILLCFAGVVGCTHAAEMTSSEWKRVLDINTTGTWFCAQAVGRKMIQQGKGGSIVFTASISAHRVNYPQPQVAYNVSKGAIPQLKSSLAAEWARHGIRVNSISPGYMDTILNRGDGLESTRNMWLAKNPMGRMGDPSELAGVVILLCSPAGKYINGADIVVDGGGSVL